MPTTRSMTADASGPAYAVGTTIRKRFDEFFSDGDFFSGTVTLVSADAYRFLYRVEYEDGDSEDLSGDEVRRWCVAPAAQRTIDLTEDSGEDSDAAPSPDRTVRYDAPSEDEREAVFHDRGADEDTTGPTHTPQNSETSFDRSAGASHRVPQAARTRAETTRAERGERPSGGATKVCTAMQQLGDAFLSFDIREGSEGSASESSASERSASESSASDSEEDRLTPKNRPEWTRHDLLKVAVAEQYAEQCNGTATIDPYDIFPDVHLLTPNKLIGVSSEKKARAARATRTKNAVSS
mmetsp:Transcript_3290/g.6832  ORF Transcript_3290/g.6832 Transcript_3290/m.6832 type:complete len:295 (-) Transcript_3290:187-1071(-)